MHIIRIGTRYFSARGGYNGRLTTRSGATLFTLDDANDQADRLGHDAHVVPV